MSLLTCNQISKSFPGVLALDKVDLSINAGEVLALCGENGAGKSTLIKVISGIYTDVEFSGNLLLNDQSVSFYDLTDAEESGIAVIYQELALIPRLSVAENIYLGHEPTRGGLIDWETLYSDAQALLQKYNIDIDVSAPVSHLGIGQQQLVEIAKALAKDSKILLLDEPSAALTDDEVVRLLEIVKQLREQGTACIYISHKLDEVFQIADRVTVLRDGQSVFTSAISDCDQATLIRHMVGRDIHDMFPYKSHQASDTILDVQDLNVFDEQRQEQRLFNISLEVQAGEVLGIGGLMGAGRSELLLHLMGAYGKRHQGTIRYKGQVVNLHNPAEAIKMGMVLVSEDRKRYGLFLPHSINFNLSIASLDRCSHGGIINAEEEHQNNQHWFDELNVKAPSLEVACKTLSGGNQQKVVLGKTLMNEPSLVLLDEPTRGIDIGAKVEIYEIINRLKSQGKAIILVSSEMPELMGMSDRIIVLAEGHIGGSFERSEFDQEKLLHAAMHTQEVSTSA